MATHSSILPGKSQGQRSLVSYGPQDRKGADTMERARTRAHRRCLAPWCVGPALGDTQGAIHDKPEAEANKFMETIEDNNWYCLKEKKEDTAFIIIWLLVFSSHPPQSSPFSHIIVFWVAPPSESVDMKGMFEPMLVKICVDEK